MYEQYSVLARYYDMLMDADYDALAGFYGKCFGSFSDIPVKTVYDLGCGTGEITYRLARDGYSVIGIDISCDMLAAAREKTDKMKISGVTLSQCDMRCFGSEILADAAVCAFDGFNYLTQPGALFETLSNIYRHLNDGGILIFDMNTPYKYKNILDGNTFTYDYDDVFLSWQSEVTKSSICKYYLTFFERDKNVWHRYDELQRQRIYGDRAVMSAVEKAGFTLVRKCSDTDFSEMDEKSQRCHYIVKKAKK